MRACWNAEEAKRPDFSDLYNQMSEVVSQNDPKFKRNSNAKPIPIPPPKHIPHPDIKATYDSSKKDAAVYNA